MKEIIKFAVWVVVLIVVFKIAMTALGAIAGSLIGLAVLAILGRMIYRAANR